MAANTFTVAFEKIFGLIEKNLKDFTVSEVIGGKEAHSALVSEGGKTYQYTSYDEGTAQDGTAGTDLVIDTNTAQQTIMDVDNTSVYTFPLSAFNRNLYRGSGDFLKNRFIDARKQLIRDVDGDFLGQFTAANNDFDDGDIGGTAGDAISLVSTNAVQVFSQSSAVVQNLTGDTMNQFCVITPKQKAVLEQSRVTDGFNVADDTLRNGFLGKNFLGISFFLSSYLSHEIVFTASSVATDTNTFVLNGITMTAVTTIGTTAGNFLIGASVTTQMAALAGLINNPSVTSSTQVALSVTNQRKLRGFTATAVAGVLTIVSNRGEMTIVNGLANTTVTTAQFVHNIIGEMGAIELAFPTGVRNVVTQEPKQPTQNFLTYAQYGVQTPRINKDRFLDLLINV